MIRIVLSTLVLLAGAGIARAETTTDLLAAADLDTGAIASVSEWGTGDMRAVLSSLGSLQPARGSSMALLYTGDTANIAACQDEDLGDPGAAGDVVGFAVDVQVPAGSRSLTLAFHFLSREYPEYVGSAYTDYFGIYLESMAWTGHIAFDADGNVITVNYVNIEHDAGDLAGTGFDCGERGGSTGWLLLTAPCVGGETLTLEVELAEQEDGILDSAVLLDGFSFSPHVVANNFSVLADPPHWTMEPASGAPGDWVDLEGVALTRLSGVAFGDAVSSDFVVHGADWAEVEVPVASAGNVPTTLLLDGLAWPLDNDFQILAGGDDDDAADDDDDDDDDTSDDDDDDVGDDDASDDDDVTNVPGADDDDTGGCDCDTAGEVSGAGAWAVGLALFGAALARGRQRQRRSQAT
jgi:MYXO-CTERM domain-containing protein